MPTSTERAITPWPVSGGRFNLSDNDNHYHFSKCNRSSTIDPEKWIDPCGVWEVRVLCRCPPGCDRRRAGRATTRSAVTENAFARGGWSHLDSVSALHRNQVEMRHQSQRVGSIRILNVSRPNQGRHSEGEGPPQRRESSSPHDLLPSWHQPLDLAVPRYSRDQLTAAPPSQQVSYATPAAGGLEVVAPIGFTAVSSGRRWALWRIRTFWYFA